jgi:haloacetate dehalogenase
MVTITRNVVRANGINLHYRECGEGPAMVLLHGWPQTSYTWRKVMPLLAAHYRCIAPDLRGMGDSDKPLTGYDMRTVATDIRALISALDLSEVYLVGSDWGGLAARRYALDWPGELDRIFIVDIVPHDQVLANFTADIARGSWHFLFNQVPDLPEALVRHDVRLFLQTLMRPKYHNPAHMDEAIDEYVSAYSKPGALRGGFAYYKAMFEQNRALDAEQSQRRIEDPIHCVWGTSGGMGRLFDVMAMWRSCAPQITGRAFEECGHYVPEEQPELLVQEILQFGRSG